MICQKPVLCLKCRKDEVYYSVLTSKQCSELCIFIYVQSRGAQNSPYKSVDNMPKIGRQESLVILSQWHLEKVRLTLDRDTVLENQWTNVNKSSVSRYFKIYMGIFYSSCFYRKINSTGCIVQIIDRIKVLADKRWIIVI